jgi:fatty-acyl-CoA synthase
MTTMTEWNFADAWEIVAATVGDRPCQICGDRVTTWAQFDRRANALASHLLGAGLGRQAKVAAYLYNGVEYLEVYYAAFKASMVPVNVNFRYGPEEVAYLLDNADAEAVVFSAAFAALLEPLRAALPRVRHWYFVADSAPMPDWATPYEAVVSLGADRVAGPWGRSGDDLLILYTGGTTGMPKGVMWRQHDLFMALGGGGNALLGQPPASGEDEYRQRTAEAAQGPGLRMLIACPLMHGTGQFSAFIAMTAGGSIVTLPGRSFDPEALWQTVADMKVNVVVIVGDAFARPLLDELDANPGRWDLSSLMLMSSSGVMWSHEVKEGLARHIPQMIMFDSLGSSEAVGVGASTSGGGASAATAEFSVSSETKVFADDGSEVRPGSGEVGVLGLAGYVPVGYYKDEEKSARTFRTIDGRRYSLPGDFATVGADGRIHLLGRGSVCINTGGEKVYPEEVEEVLKTHPEVLDAVCVGLPDRRFGETICAIVQPRGGSADSVGFVDSVDEAALIDHVRARLAHYKAPRRVITVDTIGRSPAGKVDYKGLKDLAMERTGAANARAEAESS